MTFSDKNYNVPIFIDSMSNNALNLCMRNK